jgi:hypothetical protein
MTKKNDHDTLFTPEIIKLLKKREREIERGIKEGTIVPLDLDALKKSIGKHHRPSAPSRKHSPKQP